MAASSICQTCEVGICFHSRVKSLTRVIRLYHAARLRWNSIERRRGPLEDALVDDITQWSMWNYATGKSFYLWYSLVLTYLV